MTIIKKYVEHIEEEIDGAKDYAEKYVEQKAMNDMSKANKYKEMANDELKHAMFIHEFATEKINEVSKVYNPPVEMMEKWEKAHKEYVEKVAWIRQMLNM